MSQAYCELLRAFSWRIGPAIGTFLSKYCLSTSEHIFLHPEIQQPFYTLQKVNFSLYTYLYVWLLWPVYLMEYKTLRNVYFLLRRFSFIAFSTYCLNSIISVVHLLDIYLTSYWINICLTVTWISMHYIYQNWHSESITESSVWRVLSTSLLVHVSCFACQNIHLSPCASLQHWLTELTAMGNSSIEAKCML